MNKSPRVSEAEWEVMKTLWKLAPLTSREIIQQLGLSSNWKPKTIQTLINRLVQKGAIGFQKDGRKHYYSPLITEEETIKAESDSFLRRIYGGSIQPMLVHFVKTNKMSLREIEELKRILDEGKK